MATQINKLHLFSLLVGITLLLLGTSSARSTTATSRRFDNRAGAESGTSKANFDFDSGTEWSTVNCTNVTCDKLEDIFWSWSLLSGESDFNFAQLASVNLNTTTINIFSTDACQDVLNGDPPTSFLERGSNAQKRGRGNGRGSSSRSSSKRSTTPIRPTTPADTNTEESQLPAAVGVSGSGSGSGLIQNKVKQNRKLRNKQQTAYSAIYSSFLDIDIDFDTDFDSDSDTDTDFEAESQTQTNAERRSSRNSRASRVSSFSSKKKAAAGGKYYPSHNVTQNDMFDMFVFQLCWVNNWADYYYEDSDYNYYTNAVYFCNNDIIPWFDYPYDNFPNIDGIDQDAPRTNYLHDFVNYIVYPAYDALGCTW